MIFDSNEEQCIIHQFRDEYKEWILSAAKRAEIRKMSQMKAIILEEYHEWLNSKNKKDNKKKEDENIKWRFKKGDVVPQQGIKCWWEHRKDAACEYEYKKDEWKLPTIDDLKNTYTQFGVKWTIPVFG